MKKISEQQIALFLSAVPSATQDEMMAGKTFLKIGGPARLFVVANTSDELVGAVEAAKTSGIPWYVFGGGSNLLVSDDGYEGVVIQAADRSFSINGNSVTASSGAFTGRVARAVAQSGLVGFEWGIGVPGTVGGAVYGNAGCFGGEMKDVVTFVDAYNVATGERLTLSNADCHFGYRNSRFKHEPHLILAMTMELESGDAVEATRKLEEIMGKRKDSQPQGAFSAGCLFKNFDFDDESALSVLRQKVDVPSEMLKQKRLGAGWLIDQLGLKGTTIGKAQVSPVHGNFLVNLGGATAKDVIALSSLVKMKVRDELGIMLEDEVQYLGF